MSKQMWLNGNVGIGENDDAWTAAIDQDFGNPHSSDGSWRARIECYGNSETEAVELRNKICALLNADRAPEYTHERR